MHHEPHAESTTRLLDGADIRALCTHLLQVCTVFAATAEHGADIRDYGLTPELLTACQRALSTWQAQHVSSSDVGHAGEESAAWHAYTQMLADHGDDF